MNASRFRTQLALDLRFHFTRAMFWMLLLSLLVISFGLSSGNLTISSGDSVAGGEAQAHITSEFSVGMMFPLVTFIFYSFFVAVAAGMTIPRDDELEVGPILHATRLTPREYITAKFAAVIVLFVAVLAVHVLFTILFNQIVPHPRAELIRGPFVAMNYVRPALVFALPFVIFLCGASFAIGERWRKPILVFVAPVALFLVSIFFLWDWSPSWLDPRINKVLMWIEPSGFRWINETWLKVDKGVAYYNSQPITYDLPFLLSRLAYTLLGVGFFLSAGRHFAKTLRGQSAASGKALPGSQTESSPAGAARIEDLRRPSLASIGMKSSRPGFPRTLIDVTRFEVRNLRAQAGLYIFVPLILFQTINNSFFRVGPFDSPVLLTPGMAAVTAMNTLTMLVTLLILFYTVESLAREWNTGIAPIYYASPARTGAILAGKSIANGVVGAAILVAAYVGAAVVMLVQGKVTPSIGPFALVWGLLLIPTFLAWSAFATAVFTLTRNRYTTYGIGLVTMLFTGWRQERREMNWVGNWNLWSTTTWSDFGGLDPNVRALFVNRLFWLSVAVFLVALTVRIFPRRDHDPSRVIDRLSIAGILRAAWRLLPAALPAIVLGCFLGYLVASGPEGGAAERRNEEYRARNLLTWADAETPQFSDVDIDLTLDPDDHSFAIVGSYELINNSKQPMRRFPLSVGDHFKDIEWTLNGKPYEPENWARLYVFTPPEPLAPADTISVGFKYHGRLPSGISKNGGGLREFILPSGVVLTGFSTSFVPLPFFELDRGVDRDNRLEPRNFGEGFWEGQTRPGWIGGARYSVRTKITGPERFAYHGVGVLESETVKDGRRTVVWKSDQPVNFFNVVAGEWSEWKGDGVAVYYHPDHTYNIEEIGKAVEAARRYYSEWFYPYPWQELKISEFPGIASYAQGFPTNITFSESIGFLTRSTPETKLAFMVTAHESAHQWWGNILMPGEGPGGNILSEGMAHFSTGLLAEQVNGLESRIEFFKAIEDRYGDNRRVDSERPLVWTDDSKAGDTTVTYDKGGWVFWMLLNEMGRENALAGIQDFVARYAATDDYPVLQDFIAVMREHAPDPDAYQAFVDQWFFDIVVPQYRIENAVTTKTAEGWTVTAEVTNIGTGVMSVEVAATSGDRFLSEEDADKLAEYRDARTPITLGPGESRAIRIETPFEPKQVIVDPDALVLMLNREQALSRL